MSTANTLLVLDGLRIHANNTLCPNVDVARSQWTSHSVAEDTSLNADRPSANVGGDFKATWSAGCAPQARER